MFYYKKGTIPVGFHLPLTVQGFRLLYPDGRRCGGRIFPPFREVEDVVFDCAYLDVEIVRAYIPKWKILSTKPLCVLQNHRQPPRPGRITTFDANIFSHIAPRSKPCGTKERGYKHRRSGDVSTDITSHSLNPTLNRLVTQRLTVLKKMRRTSSLNSATLYSA